MCDATKKQRSHDPAKILKKYPDHIPVVCSSWPHGALTQKLLVPKQMKRDEFISVARTRCHWGTRESEITLADGSALPHAENMNDVYTRHASSDKLLHVSVHVGRHDEEDKLPRTLASEEGEASGAEERRPSAPQVFHMPDNDHATQLDDDAQKSREKTQRLTKKYPDRVPVLVKQAESIGLPYLDKKLLVPKSMTCAGLQQILPKHLGIQRDSFDWKSLYLYMGDEPLKDDALMSEVYKQYVDEQDGGLHITLRMNLPMQLPEAHEEDRYNESSDLAAIQSELDHSRNQLQQALAKAEAAEKRAAAAEQRADESEHTLTLETEKALEAELKMFSLEESLSFAAERVKQLQEEAMQAAEREQKLQEEIASKRQEFARLQAFASELQSRLDSQISEVRETLSAQNLAEEAAWAAKLQAVEARADKAEVAKEMALAEAKRVSERLSISEDRMRGSAQEMEQMKKKIASETAEKIKAQKEAKDLLEQLDKARDGFVHIHCDRFGLVTETPSGDDNEFEVLPA
mmetsp:Transcript_18983/g.30836  ORF Transcript_18983/g.30836 Transcript_18983/m.30836 type:complete len:519 (+) Transcript_18983:71-1627(+)|eukprot:CAMPEP_0169068924 /NCGR_PEP_ID=MMETSP1015-20121227/4292_1 /TAXON_ID=342587 /ORGANISM="Karlodinium micrum, Strain CCMP2283" /LENGTH=518 /DNA_ID=CAMNT_0009127789 /DNA_START=70 /DNA_END=1626 /DNA_ORIENTATION=-